MAMEIGFFAAFLVLLACLVMLKARGATLLKRPSKFSLRDLLLVTTLLAAIFGLLAYAIRVTDEDGRRTRKYTEWKNLDRLEQ